MFSPGLSSQSPSEQGPGVSYSQERRPSVESPFWILFIFGNISRCNGCKGRISRDQNKKLLPPLDDIVFGHKEYVINGLGCLNSREIKEMSIIIPGKLALLLTSQILIPRNT